MDLDLLLLKLIRPVLELLLLDLYVDDGLLHLDGDSLPLTTGENLRALGGE